MAAVRGAAYLSMGLAGALVGVAGALVQGAWFPGGLLLALLAIAALCYGGARVTGARTGGVAPAAGWLVAVVLLTTARPEGDFLFATGLGSYVYLLGGMLVAVMCATLPRLPSANRHPARLGK